MALAPAGSPVLPAISFPGHLRLWVSTPPSPSQTKGLSKEPLLLRQQCVWARCGAVGRVGLTGSCVPSQSVVRICCIRSFGHFIAHLQGSILQFSAEAGIFVSIAQSEQEGVLQQAQAQFRMVSRPAPHPLLCSCPPGSLSHPGPLMEEHGGWGFGDGP